MKVLPAFYMLATTLRVLLSYLELNSMCVYQMAHEIVRYLLLALYRKCLLTSTLNLICHFGSFAVDCWSYSPTPNLADS